MSDSRVRVAIDYRPALFSRSGISRSVRELVRALSQCSQDSELVLFAHAWKRALDPNWREGLAETVHVARSRLPGRVQPWLARLGLDARRLAKGADIFHITDFVQPPLGRSARVVMTVHDLAFHADPRFHGASQSLRLARRLERLLRHDPLLVFPSRASRDAFVAQYGTKQRLQVIPFGSDHARRQGTDPERGRRLAQRLLGSEEPFVLCLGTIEPRKNHDVLLHAHETLAERGRPLPLLVVGAPGWECDAVQHRLARGQERFPLHWASTLEDADCFDLLAAARVLAYPSSLEGFGFPPLEGLELGTPCVVGDCPALREQLGEAACFVPPRDHESLAEQLLRCYSREELRREQLAAWEARHKQRSWQRCAERYLEAYREAASD
ncbi:MAG: hypothetical protein CSA62_05905 [Planctomycetota bacterium]|nr:MAG: hypothetical protein CSA62_05905 [Planctomycetota bacterium]